MLSLLVMSKEGVLQKALSAGSFTAGRADECEIRLDDAKASRRHVLIEVGREVSVTDLGSRNGTLLGTERLPPNQPVVLRTGVPLVIGSTVMIVQADARQLPPLALLSEEAFAARVLEAQRAGGTFGLAAIHFLSSPHAPSLETLGATGTADGAAAARLDRGLRELVRAGDVVAYVGPAQYRVLLVGATEAIATQLADRLRAGLAAHELLAEVGVALFPRDGRTLVELSQVASGSVRPRETPAPPRASALAQLAPLIDRVAVGNINVLILGETGVGKEVLAHAVHERSKRASAPMLCLNCAAMSESLLESELFGYERGAFTGAVQAKVGLLESADGGTVLLDELGEMPLSVQARLLRVLEQREVMRLGSVKPRSIDIRLISATNRDLEAEVAAGRFRQDLFFRINGVVLTVPPLRERRDEIEPLANEFAARICKAAGRDTPPSFSRETLAIFDAYRWPGNVRELRNVVERAVLMAGDRDCITPDDLPLDRLLAPAAVRAVATVEASGERQRILDALEQCAGNQTRAAELLGISRRTLVSRIKEYDIPRPQKRS